MVIAFFTITNCQFFTNFYVFYGQKFENISLVVVAIIDIIVVTVVDHVCYGNLANLNIRKVFWTHIKNSTVNLVFCNNKIIKIKVIKWKKSVKKY